MPQPTPAPDSLAQLRPRLLGRIRAYLRQTKFAPIWEAETVLEDLQGAIWLEMHCSSVPVSWKQALRKALYREWETRRPSLGNQAERFADQRPNGGTQTGTHSEFTQKLFLAGWPDCGLGRASKQMGLTRRELKLRLTALWKDLEPVPGFRSIQQRISRLIGLAGTPCPPSILRRDARQLLRLMAQLDLPVHLVEIRPVLTILAERKLASPLGNPEFANADKELHAKEEG